MQNKFALLAILVTLLFFSCTSGKKEQLPDRKMTHAEMMEKMFPPAKIKIKTIGILLYDGYTTLDAMGPYQVLSEMTGTSVFFVGKKKGLIANMSGVKVQVDTSINEVKNLDILVVPGGLRDTYAATRDMQIIEWIKKIDSSSIFTTSVCTGAWILGAAGLLQGKEATTHWYGKKILSDQFGAVIKDQRYVRSGKYWTSAGVTAGMDMSIALVNEIMGEKYTKTAMLDLEYDPQPMFYAGSEQNTEKDIVEMMRMMYDSGMETALHPEKVFRKMSFANKRDYICNMPVSAGVVDTAHYNNGIYGFCSKECKEAFVKNPVAHLSKVNK
jgi:putative intracellular protease/amidase/YHS domain-containing protein